MNNVRVITGKCSMCDYKVEIKANDEQIKKLESGAKIQNVFPEVSAADRELLISRTCGACFDKMFGHSVGHDM